MPATRLLAAAALFTTGSLLAGCGTSTDASSANSSATDDTVTGAPSTADDSAKPDRDDKDADKSSKKDKGGDGAATATPAGVYVSWADYQSNPATVADRKVVLFFHADWCSSCRATQESIDADGVPDGMALVKVDYDNANDLRQKYGVTVQHTFVQVDDTGSKLAIWSGSISGADILAKTV